MYKEVHVKSLKNHDIMAIILLMVTVLSAYTLRDNVLKRAEYVEKQSTPSMNYSDIDTQTQPVLDSGY